MDEAASFEGWDEPVADLEVGRYALRSFEFVEVSAYHDSEVPGLQALADELGWWEDNTCKVWRSPSYHGGTDWQDGTCVAECRVGAWRHGDDRHEVPHEDCTCGIYGSLSYADLIAQFTSYVRFMVAVIAAEGVTIVGSRGLRTQFARVVAYWVDPDPVRREVAAVQFRDAKVFDTPLELVEAYGLSLLPPKEARQGGGGPQWWTKPAGPDSAAP